MLHALLRNRTGRADPDGESVGGSGLERYEDPLTAAVFERLAYLPAEWLIPVLARACRAPLAGLPLPRHPGQLRRWEFWPSLWLPRARPTPDGRLRDRVEPDVLVVFDKATLVFEAKHRMDHHGSQWTREVLAARLETENSPTWLVAVGARPGPEAARVTREESHAMGVLFCSWRSLASSLRALRRDPELLPHQARVVDDVLLALAAFGYGPRARPATLPAYRPTVPLRLRTRLPAWGDLP